MNRQLVASGIARYPAANPHGPWNGWLTISYLRARANPDGGYSFAQGAESSAADTYYAVRSLRLLGATPDNPDLTARFLRTLLRPDGAFVSIAVAWFVTVALGDLGAAPPPGLAPYLLSLDRGGGIFGSLHADIESPSELQQTYLALDLLKTLGVEIRADRARAAVLERQNRDGSFGRGGYSHLAAMHHALGILAMTEPDAAALDRALAFVRACEDPRGGFRRSPDAADPYLVLDDAYFGLRCLHALRASPRYADRTLARVGHYQNANGGFRRSPFGGIATFETTYYAIAASSLSAAGSGDGDVRSPTASM